VALQDARQRQVRVAQTKEPCAEGQTRMKIDESSRIASLWGRHIKGEPNMPANLAGQVLARIPALEMGCVTGNGTTKHDHI